MPPSQSPARNSTVPEAPHKWRKYRLLALFGLTNEELLRRTIHRFPWDQRFHALKIIRGALSDTATSDGDAETLFVVKFVPPKLAMLLPNFRIEHPGDMLALEYAVDHPPRGDFKEIWFCRTNIRRDRFSVGGRILLDQREVENAQMIEQVWRCSPRLIESIGPDFPYPFIRARREGWAWSPKIEYIHSPVPLRESKRLLREQFGRSLTRINRLRERLEIFADSVFSTGVKVLSFEYKIEGEFLQIIDWDTGDDSRVLRELLLNEGT